MSIGNSCVLHSIDLVIAATPDGVVLQNRHYQLVVEPYDPATCTPQVAAERRDEMTCASMLELVGALAPPS